MIKLDLLRYRAFLRVSNKDEQSVIFDPVRKKWIVLTAEEMVRQLLIQHLSHTKGYPLVRMSVERQLKYNQMSKRYDLAIFDKSGKPYLLAECKAPSIQINADVFFQAALYNLDLAAPIMLVTNGWKTFCCEVLFETHSYIFLDEIPEGPH